MENARDGLKSNVDLADFNLWKILWQIKRKIKQTGKRCPLVSVPWNKTVEFMAPKGKNMTNGCFSAIKRVTDWLGLTTDPEKLR